MSHRNSQPKPSASERTLRRHRERHEISTVADEAHKRHIDEIKENIKSWFTRTPKEEENDLIVKPMAGKRNVHS